MLLFKLVIIQQLCKLLFVKLGNKAPLNSRTSFIAFQALTQFIKRRSKHIKLNLKMVADIQGIGKNNRLINIDEEELNCLKRRFYTAEGNGNKIWARLLTVELFDIGLKFATHNGIREPVHRRLKNLFYDIQTMLLHTNYMFVTHTI